MMQAMSSRADFSHPSLGLFIAQQASRRDLRGLCFAMPTCNHNAKDPEVLWKNIQTGLVATANTAERCEAKKGECRKAYKAFRIGCEKLMPSK